METAIRRFRHPSSASLSLACGFAALAAGCTPSGRGEPELTIAAAASLRRALPELADAFRQESGPVRIRISYGASGSLRRQVEAGAPADLLLFAASEPVDSLIAQGLVDPRSRTVVATNRLVLISPEGKARGLTFADLDRLPPGEHLAIGDPEIVPAGDYARRLLRSFGHWQELRGRLVLGGHVGAVLAYVRRGEVAAGIVYETEARGVAGVWVRDRAASEPVPRVVAGVVRGAAAADLARSFLAFLGSPRARQIFAAHGFGPV